MSIFKKKLDFEKNHLRFEFSLERGIYIVYQGFNEISFDSLNRKTKKILNQKNIELRSNQELLNREVEQAKMIKRFRKLKSMGYTCSSFEYLGPVNGTMSKKMKNYLEALTNSDEVLLGIHRVGQLPDFMIKDILVNGLKITGHLNGATASKKNLSDNVSYYPSNKTIIKELMYANEYKSSKGSILIKIPDRDLLGNIFIINDRGEILLDPKYILGYVPVDEKHHIDTIITPIDLQNTEKKNIVYSNTYPTYEETSYKTR